MFAQLNLRTVVIILLFFFLVLFFDLTCLIHLYKKNNGNNRCCAGLREIGWKTEHHWISLFLCLHHSLSLFSQNLGLYLFLC